MNEKYREELITWGIRTVAVIALTVVTSLLYRWLGVTVEPPPPPAVNVVIEHKPGLLGGAPPAVRVEPVGK